MKPSVRSAASKADARRARRSDVDEPVAVNVKVLRWISASVLVHCASAEPHRVTVLVGRILGVEKRVVEKL